MKTAVLAILGIFAIQAFAPAAASADEPLQVDRAFAISASRGPGGSLSVEWDIADGYYLYRDRIAARTPNGAALTVETSPGLVKDDPNFGPSEIYYGHAEATLPKPGSGPVELTYQGCQEDDICYAPETRLMDPVTLAVSDPSPPGTYPAVDWKTEALTPSTVETGPQGSAIPSGFDLAADEGLIQSLLGQGGSNPDE